MRREHGALSREAAELGISPQLLHYRTSRKLRGSKLFNKIPEIISMLNAGMSRATIAHKMGVSAVAVKYTIDKYITVKKVITATANNTYRLQREKVDKS